MAATAPSHRILSRRGNNYYFTAQSSQIELYKTQGTTSSTALVRTVGALPSYPTAVGNNLFYGVTGADLNVPELYMTDGTTAGARMGSQGPVGPPVEMGGALYYASPSSPLYSTTDIELWKSNGTVGGTARVKDISSTNYSSSPGDLVSMNGRIYFFATSGGARTLWRSDGTLAGTVQVHTVQRGGPATSMAMVVSGSTLYFAGADVEAGAELWKSDGTTAGTMHVKDIRQGSSSSLKDNAPAFAVLSGKVYFCADDGIHGPELWVSDGTADGTKMVRDIGPGPYGSIPSEITAVGNAIWFAADDGEHGRELWSTYGYASDPTPYAALFADIQPGAGSSSPSSLATQGDLLFFIAEEPAQGRSFWVASGANRTAFPLSLPPEAGSGWLAQRVQSMGNLMYMVANSGQFGSEPYVYELPTLALASPMNITRTSAGLNGFINPNGQNTLARFEYGLTASYGTAAYTSVMQVDPYHFYILGSDKIPQGFGFALMTVSKYGTVTFTGTLPEGTGPVVISAPLSAYLNCGLFTPLHGAKGSFVANFNFDLMSGGGNASGGGNWFRPALDSQHYPKGWANVPFSIHAAKYQAVSGQSVVLTEDGTMLPDDEDYQPDPLSPPNAHGNARLSAPALFYNSPPAWSVNLSSADKVTKVSGYENGYTLTIDRQTGLITGTFADPVNATPIPYRGIIYQRSLPAYFYRGDNGVVHAPGPGGYGFFLTPTPARKNYAGQSGPMVLIGQPGR